MGVTKSNYTIGFPVKKSIEGGKYLMKSQFTIFIKVLVFESNKTFYGSVLLFTPLEHISISWINVFTFWSGLKPTFIGFQLSLAMKKYTQNCTVTHTR